VKYVFNPPCPPRLVENVQGEGKGKNIVKSVKMTRKCSHTSSPRAWARLRRSGWALRLVCTPLRCPSAGQKGEASTTPIERVANCGFLF
jgi:hypothetical protein